MRKLIEISLVAKRPHLFHQSILNGLGISTENQESSEGNRVGFRWGYKDENFFECGEGWMPIIAAFAESLDHFLTKYEIAAVADDSTTEEATVFINGAMSHHNRLCIVINRSSEFDDAILGKIRAMQEFATAMSGLICEVCGSPVKGIELNNSVRCAVCRCRQI